MTVEEFGDYDVDDSSYGPTMPTGQDAYVASQAVYCHGSTYGSRAGSSHTYSSSKRAPSGSENWSDPNRGAGGDDDYYNDGSGGNADEGGYNGEEGEDPEWVQGAGRVETGFGCPLRKGEPQKYNYRNYPKCADRLKDFPAVKKHLREYHHIMEDKLRARRKDSKIGGWENMWIILFPKCDQSEIPSSRYEPCKVLEDFEVETIIYEFADKYRISAEATAAFITTQDWSQYNVKSKTGSKTAPNPTSRSRKKIKNHEKTVSHSMEKLRPLASKSDVSPTGSEQQLLMGSYEGYTANAYYTEDGAADWRDDAQYAASGYHYPNPGHHGGAA